MRTIDVGVGHDDDFAVTQFADVEVFTNAGLQSLDQRSDFFEAQHLVEAGLFDIQNLATQRQNGLGGVVPTALGGTTGRITFDQEQFAVLNIVGSAVSKLLRHPAGLERAFAFDELPGLARRLTSLSRQHCFLTDPLGFSGVFFQPQPKLLADHFRDEGLRLGVEQLLLGLVVERGIRQSHGDNRRDAFPQVFARRGEVLQKPLLLGVRVDGTRELVAEARQMGAAVGVHNVVAEGQHQFTGGIGVLQRNLCSQSDFFILGPHRDHWRPDGLLAVEVSHIGGQTVFAVEDFLTHRAAGVHTLVAKMNANSRIEIRQLPQAVLEGFEPKNRVGENVRVRLERNPGAPAVPCLAHFTQRLRNLTPRKINAVVNAFTEDLHGRPLGQSVHALHPDAVQTTRDFVRVVVKFSARVQLGHDDFDRRPTVDRGVVRLHGVGGHTAAVVGHGRRTIGFNPHLDMGGVTSHRFVDGVVDTLPHQVVKRVEASAANVHTRPLSDRIQALKDLNRAGVVIGRLTGRLRGRISRIAHSNIVPKQASLALLHKA